MKKLDAYCFEYGSNHETVTNILNNRANFKYNYIHNQRLKILATEAAFIQSFKYEGKVQYKEGKSHDKGHRMRTQYKVFHNQRKGKPYTVLVGLSSEIA